MSDQLMVANAMVQAGRFWEARDVLAAFGAAPEAWPVSVDGALLALVTARAARGVGDLAASRAAATRAIGIATAIEAPELLSGALEAAAITEKADGNLQTAGEYYRAGERAALVANDQEGRAAILLNHANMLVDNDLEGAEPMLRVALGLLAPGSHARFAAIDNLGLEMARQGLHDVAAEHAREAAEGFAVLGARRDQFQALRSRARHLRNAGRVAEVDPVVREAYGLIFRMRSAEVDLAYYATYPDRVRAIEQRTSDVFEGSPLEIGIHATLGDELRGQGIEELERGDLAAAIGSLRKSRTHWERLRADHELISVDYHLGLALIEAGDQRPALEMFSSALGAARQLGDAYREHMVWSMLCRLRSGLATGDPLDAYARARALIPAVNAQLAVDPATDVDVGTLEAQGATFFGEEGAAVLAEEHIVAAIEASEGLPRSMVHRRFFRLLNYELLLRSLDRDDDALEVADQILAEAVDAPDDWRIALVVARVEGSSAFLRGDRSEDVLRALMDECATYTELRRSLAGAASREGLSATWHPPFREAAIVALALGRERDALRLLEAGKALTLAEALDQSPAAFAADDDQVPTVDGGLGISLLDDGASIVALRMDGRTQEVTSWSVPHAHDVEPLADVVADLLAAVDSELRREPIDVAVRRVVEHPTFVALRQRLSTDLGDDRLVWLSGTGYLGGAPLNLLASPEGPAGVAILPRLSILDDLPHRGASTARAVVVGDPTSDLPFARIEAQLVALPGDAVALGDDATFDWFAGALAAGASIVHIACHGRFDNAHPERSGLQFALPVDRRSPDDPGNEPVTLERLGHLDFGGAVVILSACNSGKEAVRTGDESSGLVTTLLEAGASCVIGAQWPVDDFASMLLMTHLHADIGRSASVDVVGALHRAARWVRELDGVEVLDRADEVVAAIPAVAALPAVEGALRRVLWAAGDTTTLALVDSLATSDAAATPEDRLSALRALRPDGEVLARLRPFDDVSNWGAFKIVGRPSAGSSEGNSA